MLSTGRLWELPPKVSGSYPGLRVRHRRQRHKTEAGGAHSTGPVFPLNTVVSLLRRPAPTAGRAAPRAEGMHSG